MWCFSWVLQRKMTAIYRAHTVLEKLEIRKYITIVLEYFSVTFVSWLFIWPIKSILKQRRILNCTGMSVFAALTDVMNYQYDEAHLIDGIRIKTPFLPLHPEPTLH